MSCAVRPPEGRSRAARKSIPEHGGLAEPQRGQGEGDRAHATRLSRGLRRRVPAMPVANRCSSLASFHAWPTQKRDRMTRARALNTGEDDDG